jgi:quinohemoprotein ethanol dehydrogenase
VFQGTVDGLFKAFNAKNGEQLWQFNTQNGIVGSPISYSIDDQQFITVPAGRGGGLSQIIGIQHDVTHVNGRILAFTLSGNASLPALEKLSIPKPPAMPEVSDDILSQGAIAYSRFCSRCHGTNVVSDGAIPDLRHLEAVWHDNFNAVVLDGMMEAAGMPRFDDVLDEQSAAAIQAFIIEQAHQDYQYREKPSRWMVLKLWVYQQLADGLKFLSEQQ